MIAEQEDRMVAEILRRIGLGKDFDSRIRRDARIMEGFVNAGNLRNGGEGVTSREREQVLALSAKQSLRAEYLLVCQKAEITSFDTWRQGGNVLVVQFTLEGKGWEEADAGRMAYFEMKKQDIEDGGWADPSRVSFGQLGRALMAMRDNSDVWLSVGNFSLTVGRKSATLIFRQCSGLNEKKIREVIKSATRVGLE